MRYEEFTIEGRNAVIEALRSGKPMDKILIQDGLQDGPIQTIKREAKKHDALVKFVEKERLTRSAQLASIRESLHMRQLMNMQR